ncbi:lipopolysaccharide heptosyltransferase I [Sulfurospirillum sp. 1612]|uniref:lipopolysaccharide heptosyltransferase I n=1 Tax=Sulfurospirillum sp. 1612 TaxID=3094835 RepID=UPI002F9410EC
MRIAIVKLSALGDIIHAMIILQYIHKNLENAHIDWFVEERFGDVLRYNPHIENIYTLRLKNNKLHLFEEYQKLKKFVKQHPYDLIIDMQGLIKSAIVARLIGRNVIGFDKHSLRESLAAFLYTKKITIAYEENVIFRNMTLVSQALSFKMPDILQKESFLFASSTSKIKPRLLIVVGSSWESKIYPKEHFIKIINALNVRTYISWGNEKERDTASFICHHTPATLLPRLSLDELKAVVSNSDLTIGADSGPTHMAWAQNRASITIFGPTPSRRNTLQTPINKTVDCKKTIHARALNKEDFCIKNIDPEEIITLAKELLAC